MIGVALSGFFDGILLHQVLQWHHLLSLVPGESIQRLTTQILADGLFHVLMYLIALAGGFWLWRRRDGLSAPGASRRLLIGVVAGFGAWNVIDVGLFHWILGIHHIRVDVTNPILWDAGWLVLFGLAPIAIALALARRSGGGTRGGPIAIVLGMALVAAGAWSLQPPRDDSEIMAVFQPGADPVAVMAAVAAVDGRLVRVVGEGSIIVLRLPEDARPWALYRHGALLVGSTGPAGCLTWSTTANETRGVSA
ncbi:MAG: DUF2243 domain-containing protein [Brevundimonas sp.]